MSPDVSFRSTEHQTPIPAESAPFEVASSSSWDVKRRGVVPPPLATFPGSSIDELADQL